MYFFFFNDPASTEIYTLSLHDALPISFPWPCPPAATTPRRAPKPALPRRPPARNRDRKSTRLNSSHSQISYAVFCLKKKKHCIKIIRSLLTLCMHDDPQPSLRTLNVFS